MLSKSIATYLQSQSLGTIGTTLFYGFLPDTPDTLTTIFETGGTQPDARMSIDYPSIQVRVRQSAGSSSFESAYNRIIAIYNALQSLHGITLSDGTTVIDITAVQMPINIGKDEKGRAEFTQNYNLTTSKTTIHRE